MEMMDIRAAIRWLNESSDLMMVIGKSLESQPKGETDFLKQELIAVQRASIEAALNSSMVTAILISEQMILELPLLMGHAGSSQSPRSLPRRKQQGLLCSGEYRPG